MIRVLTTLIFLSWVGVGIMENEKSSLTGENVCTQQVLETKQINVTYLESVRIKKHSLCPTFPFVCADWVNTMKTKWRMENITRTVNRKHCCSGYHQEEDTCQPTCSGGGCVHGTCTQPEVCSCKAGFSGSRCEKVGCPRGTWGPDCGNVCQCQHGGWCDPVTGGCVCGPGYLGDACQDTCASGSWGEDCQNQCECDKGQLCHHVTGQCSPCASGQYGDMCKHVCQCNSEGTELCSHIDGRCFCKGNWFGKNCDQHCPFGYSNHTCHTRAIDNQTCQCPNDLYTCDPELGCVCPDGEGQCGIEVLDSSVWLSPYSDLDTETDQHTAAISLSVILVAGVAIVLIIIYYRRRMSVMRKDIQNRSVYYCDRESVDTDPDRSYDLIVRDRDPVTFNNEANLASNNTNVLNNVRLNLDSQRYTGFRSSKNVNLTNAASAGATQCNVENHHEETGPDGATGATFDVNVFLKDNKSNLNQKFQSKVVKSDLETMIRNNLVDDNKNDDQDEFDNDSVHKLKVSLGKTKNCNE